MNSKQAKRLRRNTNRHLQMFLGQGEQNQKGSDITVRTRSYDRFLVDSSVYDATVNGEKQEGKALQIRLTIGCPRQVYKAVKRRVQANRKSKQGRVLSRIQLRPSQAAGAVEHTGAEGVQPDNMHVPSL